MDRDAGERADLHRRVADLMQQHRELIDRLQHGQNHFRHVARSVWRVQEDERRRLARELHDGIGQNLTALMHMIAQAQDALDAPNDAARAALQQAHALTDTMLRETRALSRLLRPQILDDLGLEAALKWLARAYADSHKLDVSLDLARPFPALDANVSTLIFRVVQEALTNVARHAKTDRALVSLHASGRRVSLRVRDEGAGCDARAALASGSEGLSSGLGGMRDRVQLFDGEFRIDSSIGAGCTVAVDFSLPTMNGANAP